jgi:hypothetical protein
MGQCDLRRQAGVLAVAAPGYGARVGGSPEHGTDTPYDAEGRVGVPGAPEWRYASIGGQGDEALAVQLEGPDDARLAFTVPEFLSRGDELGEVARIVIRAWERTVRAAGLGG